MLYSLNHGGNQEYLQGLTPNEVVDYSLWKTTRRMKRRQHHIPPIRTDHNAWAGTDEHKVTAFAEHLVSVFQLFPPQLSVMEEETINNDLNVPHQMASPMKKMRINEVENITQYKINPKKKGPGLRFDHRKSS